MKRLLTQYHIGKADSGCLNKTSIDFISLHITSGCKSCRVIVIMHMQYYKNPPHIKVKAFQQLNRYKATNFTKFYMQEKGPTKQNKHGVYDKTSYQ